MMPSESRLHPPGFTLLEVLVAMMILGISITLLMQVFSGGLQAVYKAAGYSRAADHGREKMAQLMLPAEIQPGEYAGAFGDGYRWKARITPVSVTFLSSSPVLPGAAADVPLTALIANETRGLFQVRLWIFWTDGGHRRDMVFSTLRMARLVTVENAGG
ncbi:MAG: hypothetical protein CSB33_03520 [Desulfobacterales bacterium]|nr:MAG: hypothetical protein CSB33_03520 [Desulfobacterales bacterium]